MKPDKNTEAWIEEQVSPGQNQTQKVNLLRVDKDRSLEGNTETLPE